MKPILASWLLLCPLLLAQAEDWLHWRGPMQTGASHDTGLPEQFAVAGTNVAWKQPFGCRSTPIVSRGRVYIIGSVGEGVMEQEAVTCFDAKTGKLLWQHRFNVFLADIVTNRVGWANMAADSETGNLYAHGVQGLFFCFDPDGKVLWQKSLTEEYGRVSGYGGRITSPIVDGPYVIMNMLNASWGDHGRGGHRFLAMDKKTGEIIWWSQPGGPPLDTIYSVPVAHTINNERLIICGGADGFVHAIKRNTGEKVWSYPLTKRGVNVSPVVDEAKGWVYICHSEENMTGNVQGLTVCLDAKKITDGKPAVVWERTGLLVGYASPLLHDGRLYLCDNGAKMFCLDAATGKTLWEHKYGRSAKGSPVWADGKIYVCEVGARWHILKPGDAKCETIHSVRFTRPDGLVIECNGSPAVAEGRVYLTTADEIYCLVDANKQPKAGVSPISPQPKVDLGDSTPHLAMVEPVDVTLHPGAKQTFQVAIYNAQGYKIPGVAGTFQVSWSLPTTPPPPGSPPNMAPIPALKGAINEQGELHVPADVAAQSGVVLAQIKMGDRQFAAKARVRVAPTLPYAQDFSQIELGRIPTGWINLAGKFQVVALPEGGQALKKLANNPNPLLCRAFAYITQPDAAEYTIQGDLMGTERKEPNATFLPDMGIVNCRYVLCLDGGKQKLWLRSWEANRRIDKTIDFAWRAGAWYTFKLHVTQEGDKAKVQGKVWERGQPEPSQWTVEFDDPCPNRHGSPALYAYATGVPADGKGAGAEVFYQNVKVIPNKK